VAQFDHHNFLVACVGERNRFRYTVWLALVTGCLANLLQRLHQEHDWGPQDNKDPNLRDFLALNIGFIVVASVFWGVFIFFAFTLAASLTLICANLTMFEATTHRWKLPYFHGYSACDLPFNNGVAANCTAVACGDDVSSWWACCGVLRGNGSSKPWSPTQTEPPGEPSLEGECLENPWENRHYSCC
jgi:hypothetical protein